MENKKDVFISYYAGFEEKVFLEKLVEKLREDGINYFYTEELSFGTYFTNDIFENLKNCKVGIVLCTKRSICRPWVNFETGYMLAKGIPILLIGYNIKKNELEINFPLYNFLDQQNIQFYNCSNNDEDDFIKNISQKTKELLDNTQQINNNPAQTDKISIYYPFKFNLPCFCIDNNHTSDKENISFFQDYCNNKEFSKIIQDFFHNYDFIDESNIFKRDFLKNKILFLWGSKGYYDDPMYYFLSGISFYNYKGVFIISYSYIDPQHIPSPLSNFQIFNPSIVEKIGEKVYVRGEPGRQIKSLVNKIKELGEINDEVNANYTSFIDFYQKMQDVNKQDTNEENSQDVSKGFFSERVIHVNTTRNNFIQILYTN